VHPAERIPIELGAKVFGPPLEAAVVPAPLRRAQDRSPRSPTTSKSGVQLESNLSSNLS